MSKPITRCSECKTEIEKSFDICQKCCEHEFDPDEGYYCLDCGKCGAEEVLSALYDRAKDIRKYGD